MVRQAASQAAGARRALVTGATGYIGSHLVAALLEQGWQVHAIIRPSSSLRLLEPYLERITLHSHSGSMEAMAQIIAGARPDVVYHLAAMASSEHRAEDVDDMIRSNVLFSTQLVEAMFRSGARNLVNTETFWQHATGSDEYHPVCLYAATKQAFHDILTYYVEGSRINALSLVLYDTYGSDDPRKKLLSLLKEAARENRALDMTAGEQLVDMTHVHDVVAAYLRGGEMLLAQDTGVLSTYAVTSGQRMTLRQFVELIIRETGVGIRPNWGEKPYRTNEVMTPWPGRPLPGWQPQVELASGLRDVFSDFT